MLEHVTTLVNTRTQQCRCKMMNARSHERAHALGDVSGVASFITTDEQLQ